MKTNERPQYISQLNAFHRFAEACCLPPNAQLLWLKLIDLCNRCLWEEWIQVDALRLMHWIGANDVRAVYRARDALVKAGLLEYQKGHKGCPNRYRLIFFPGQTGSGSICDSKNGSICDSKNGSICDSKNGSICDSKNGSQNGLNTVHIIRKRQDETRLN